MMWFFAVLIVLAMGAIAAVAAGRGGSMVAEHGDVPDVRLDAGPITGAGLRRVRFTTALRGYRTGEVDELLRRLAAQLEEAEARATRPPSKGAADDERIGDAEGR